MSRQISTCIFSALCWCFTLAVQAQDRIANDTTKYPYLPTGVRVGTDLLAIGKSQYTNYFKGWELNVDADIYRRFYLTADYGSWSTNYAMGNGTYASDGKYMRLGVDINFLLKDPDRNMFFLGFRHGFTRYKDYSNYTLVDDNFGEINVQAVNSDPRAHWEELTTGLRVKVWKFVWLGVTGRMKFRLRTDGQTELVSYDIPGYGRTIKNNWWGINYQLFIRIPVRD